MARFEGEVAGIKSQLEQLAQYLFDLVTKLATMRGIEAARLPNFPSTLTQRLNNGAAINDFNPMSDPGFASSADLLKYARSLVHGGGSSNRSPSKSGGRRELILPAELRLDGAPVINRPHSRR